MANINTWVSRAFLCFAFVGFTLVAASTSDSKNEHIQLLLSMLGNSKNIMPSTEDGSALNVTVDVTPVRFLSLENNVLTLLVFETVQWTDNRLKPLGTIMDTTDATYEFSLPAHLIWTPDLEYYTVIAKPELLNQQDNVVVRSDGQVTHVLFKKITSPCSVVVDSTYSCSIKIGSWTHMHNDLALNYLSEHVRVEGSFNVDGQLALEDGSVRRNLMKYQCCPEIYGDVTYTLVVRKI